MNLQLVERGPVRVYPSGIARAMLRRESQRVTLADRLREIYRGSEVEKRHAAGLQLHMALGINAASGPGFNGNFASIFPGALQIIQTDLGLTYGGTPFAAGTTPPVVTSTGALTAKPVPILAKCTNAAAIGSGAQFSIYYDGTGTTPAMTGVTPAVGTPIALTGVGAGLSWTWAAGTAALNNTWTATGTVSADQTSNHLDAAQATATRQPIVGIGLNGRVHLQSDGVDDYLQSNLALPNPTITPTYIYGVVRDDSWISGRGICGPTTNFAGRIMQLTGTNNLIQGGFGNVGNAVATTTGTWNRLKSYVTGSSATALLQVGSTVAAGADDGHQNTACTAFNLFGERVTTFAACSWLLFVALPYLPSAAQIAAADAAVNSVLGYGAGNVGL